jgi:hypothetical protein
MTSFFWNMMPFEGLGVRLIVSKTVLRTGGAGNKNRTPIKNSFRTGSGVAGIRVLGWGESGDGGSQVMAGITIESQLIVSLTPRPSLKKRHIEK